MKNEYITVRRFKNGNVSIRLTQKGVDELRAFPHDDLVCFCDWLADFELSFFGETYCISNYEEGHSLFDGYNYKVFVFSWLDYEKKIKNGQAVRLKARTVDDADKELLELEGLI